jgi:hypothetical protein
MKGAFVVFAMLVPHAAVANPPLVAHELGDLSRHMEDDHGASNLQHDVSIAIELHADHKLSVTAKGTRNDHELSETSNTDEMMAWTTTWRRKARAVIKLGSPSMTAGEPRSFGFASSSRGQLPAYAR